MRRATRRAGAHARRRRGARSLRGLVLWVGVTQRPCAGCGLIDLAVFHEHRESLSDAAAILSRGLFEVVEVELPLRQLTDDGGGYRAPCGARCGDLALRRHAA